MRALDLFCGAGGAALGLFQAGFEEVVGIDIEHKHHNVYPGTFIQADIEHLPVRVEDFDFVWASPPCQRFSFSTLYRRDQQRKHPDYIPATRDIFNGHPFTCIENVPPAPIRQDLMLTGPMVGLTRILRRRHFELSFFCLAPPKVASLGKEAWESGHAMTVTTSMCSSMHYYARKKLGLPGRVPVAEAREAMGIDTPMTMRQVGEAVPPAYSEFIGREAIKQIRRENGR